MNDAEGDHRGGISTFENVTYAHMCVNGNTDHRVVQHTMDCVIKIANQVERTKGLSLNNNRQQCMCQA